LTGWGRKDASDMFDCVSAGGGKEGKKVHTYLGEKERVITLSHNRPPI